MRYVVLLLAGIAVLVAGVAVLGPGQGVTGFAVADTVPGQSIINAFVGGPQQGWQQSLQRSGVAASVLQNTPGNASVVLERDGVEAHIRGVTPDWQRQPEVTVQQDAHGMDEFVWVDTRNFTDQEEYDARVTLPDTYASVYRCDGEQDNPDCSTIPQYREGQERPYYRVNDGTTTVYMNHFSGTGGNYANLSISYFDTSTLDLDIRQEVNVTANVTCSAVSGHNCGTVEGELQYATHDNEPGTAVSTESGVTPFWISGGSGGGTSSPVETFDDGDIAEYSGNTGSFNVQSSTTYGGSDYALVSATSGGFARIYNSSALDSGNMPQRGDTFNIYVRGSDVGTGDNLYVRPAFAVQDGGTYDNFYFIQLGFHNDYFSISEEVAGSDSVVGDSDPATADTTLSPGLSADTWYRIEVDWGSDGNMSASIYDDTDTLMATVFGDDSTWDSGEIGFEVDDRVAADVYFDEWTIGTSTTSAATAGTVSQEDWNLGTFNGTSADRKDNSGTLGIGYRNETETEKTVDGLEDGDISEYSRDTGSFSVASGAARTGSFGLNFTGVGSGYQEMFSYPGDGLPNYVSKGDTFSFWARSSVPDGGTFAQAEFAFGKEPADVDDDYYTIFIPFEDGDFAITKHNDTVDGAQVTDSGAFTNSPRSWYKAEVQWFRNDTISATLYNNSGDQLSHISYTDNSGDINGNGVGWRGYSDGPVVHFDDYTVKPDDLVGYWQLDRGSGSVIDYSGNGNDGTNNGAARGADGVFGTDGFSFDSANSEYVDMGSPTSLDLTSMPNFTISGWGYLTDTSGDKNLVAYGSGEVELRYDNGHDSWTFDVDGTGGYKYANYSQTPQTGEWVHLVGRYADGDLSIFVNGVEGSWTSTATDINDEPAEILTIGRNGGLDGRYWDGMIDEVRIYDRALSDNEIQQLYFYGQDNVFDGNYTSDTIDTSSTQVWNDLQVDATVPGDTSLDVVFQALDSGGSVVEEQVIAVSGGTNNYTLDVQDSRDARWMLNGTSTNASRSWEVNDVKVFYGGTTSSNPSTCSEDPLQGGSECSLRWLVNATQQGGFNLDAAFSSNYSGTSADSGNRYVRTDIGFLNVSLDSPVSSPFSLAQYGMFWLNASITCSGETDDDCGEVRGASRYGTNDPLNIISTSSGATPFFVQEGSGGPGSGVVDDFEDGNLDEYTGDTGSFNIQSGTAWSGNALSSSTDNINIYSMPGDGLDVYPKAGDDFSFYVRSTNASAFGNNLNQRVAFGRQDSNNLYQVQINWHSEDNWFLQTQESGTFHTLDEDQAISGDLSRDTWYQVNVSWGNDGNITAELIDAGSGTVKSTITAVDNNWTSGGVRFNADNNLGETLYWDEWTIGRSETSTADITKTLGDWNAGTFNGTSADRKVYSGTLGIGYPSGDYFEGLEGFWRLDRAVSGSGGTVADYGTTKGPIDTFDDGNLNEYTGDTGEFNVQSGTAWSGNALVSTVTSCCSDMSSSSGLSSYPEQGDEFSIYVRSNVSDAATDNVMQRIRFGRQNSTSTYQVQINWHNGDNWYLHKRHPAETGGTAILASDTTIEGGLSPDTWYRVDIDWGTDGTITAELVNPNTGDVKSTISAADTTFTSGDIGIADDIRVGAELYWDEWTGDFLYGVQRGNTSGGVTTGATGVFGTNAFDFDGSDDYVDIPDVRPAHFTVSTWINPDTVTPAETGGPVDDTIFTLEAATGSNLGMLLGVNASGHLEGFVGNNSHSRNLKSSSTLVADKWQHVAMTFDGSTVALYLNGEQEATASLTGTLWFAGTRDSYIGVWDTGFVNPRWFDGTIDEVLLFSEGISAQEVKQLYFNTTADKYFEGNYTSATVDTSESTTSWDTLQVNTSLGGSGGSSGEVVDDFEDGDIDEYGGSTDFDVVSSPTYDGTDFALASSGSPQFSRITTSNPPGTLPQRGDSFTFYVRSDAVGNGDNLFQRPTFGFQDGDNFYYAVIRWHADPQEFAIQKEDGGSDTVLDSVTGDDTSLSLSADTWYRVEVDWGDAADNDNITARLYNDDTDTLVSRVWGTDSTWDSGDMGFEIDDRDTGAEMYIDEWTLGLPSSGTKANAIFQTIDSSGSVSEEEVFTLSGGVNNYSLTVADEEDARWIINGTSNDAENTWEVGDVSLYYTTPSGVNNPVACPSSLSGGQSCTLNWRVNATTSSGNYNFDANVTSSTYAGLAENDTADVSACVGSSTGDASGLVCSPPESGDWTIGCSCYIDSSVTAPANVEVNNGATVNVTENGVLDIDMQDYHLLVRSTSKVLVDALGSIS